MDIVEWGALSQLSHQVKTWRADALHALRKTPDLKQLQHLIVSGESLPVAFPDYIDDLRAKLAQAEAWVERVRNAVPRQKTRSNIDVKKASDT